MQIRFFFFPKWLWLRAYVLPHFGSNQRYFRRGGLTLIFEFVVKLNLSSKNSWFVWRFLLCACTSRLSQFVSCYILFSWFDFIGDYSTDKNERLKRYLNRTRYRRTLDRVQPLDEKRRSDLRNQFWVIKSIQVQVHFVEKFDGRLQRFTDFCFFVSFYLFSDF